MPEAPALEVRNVHRHYQLGGHDLHVLRGVSLEVALGEKVFLCGASGSGKTTLLYILGGLEKPTQGEVFIYRKPANDGSEGLEEQGVAFNTRSALYAASSSVRALIRNEELGFV